ncbi:hypothetical protein GCK72_022483 [Caenorhabditis remanei]|uniref:Uncharacterized protein n=1 Tax=Caenorhabditis remanei TaxID=31234 RepID=A0A6A5FTY9_CAERE|nr:hypothetical protein GCK72_022483 [Caenorhabditis remanei]KAF1746032.1 hypothetical protein GCK72_022483 [Caenorhabditis remanei]
MALAECSHLSTLNLVIMDKFKSLARDKAVQTLPFPKTPSVTTMTPSKTGAPWTHSPPYRLRQCFSSPSPYSQLPA